MHVSLNNRIRRLFAEHLNILVPSNDTDLVGSGLLDSLALVDLLLRIEQEMGIVIQLDSLELEVFRTVDAIATYLQSRIKKSA